MIKYLVDSDIIINYLKGKAEVVKLLQKIGKSALAVSVITLAEILEGVIDDPQRTEEVEDFFQEVEILNINPDIAKVFAQERAGLRKKGNLIDNFDLLIASTAIYSKRILITGNKKDFTKVANLKLLG